MCGFVRLIADRQLRQFFAIEGLPICRRQKAVDDDVVDKLGTHRPGISEKIDLDRRRPVGKDPGPAVRRIAGKIDQDVDSVAMHLRGRLRGRQIPDVDEPIEGADEPRAHRAAVIRTAGVGDDVEMSAIVALEHSSD